MKYKLSRLASALQKAKILLYVKFYLVVEMNFYFKYKKHTISIPSWATTILIVVMFSAFNGQVPLYNMI